MRSSRAAWKYRSRARSCLSKRRNYSRTRCGAAIPRLFPEIYVEHRARLAHFSLSRSLLPILPPPSTIPHPALVLSSRGAFRFRRRELVRPTGLGSSWIRGWSIDEARSNRAVASNDTRQPHRSFGKTGNREPETDFATEKEYRFARRRGAGDSKRLFGTVADRSGRMYYTYIVSGLPRYRPARRTASTPIRPCPRDYAREPGNAPRRYSALSACRLPPELAASRKASLGTGESDRRVALERGLKGSDQFEVFKKIEKNFSALKSSL